MVESFEAIIYATKGTQDTHTVTLQVGVCVDASSLDHEHQEFYWVYANDKCVEVFDDAGCQGDSSTIYPRSEDVFGSRYVSLSARLKRMLNSISLTDNEG